MALVHSSLSLVQQLMREEKAPALQVTLDAILLRLASALARGRAVASALARGRAV